MFRPGDKPIKNLELVRKLGAGQFGEVWEASGALGLRIALKIIEVDPQDLHKALKEIRGLRRVTHVHHGYLTPVHSVWILDRNGDELDDSMLRTLADTSSPDLPVGPDPRVPARLLFGMELANKSLMDRLQETADASRPRGIPRRELLRYMRHAAEAIDFLNEPRHQPLRGSDGIRVKPPSELVAIRHCDIKPDNILLLGNVAKICDFGLARMADSTGAIRKTTTGLAGSLPYMAPELLGGDGPSETSDQYAFAITYYELATGHLPFDAATIGSHLKIMDAHRAGKLDFSHVGEEEQAFLRRATNPNADSRFASCQELVSALDKLHTSTDTESIPSPAPEVDPAVRDSFVFEGSLEPDAVPVPHHRLLRFLGKGQFGEVWEAEGPYGNRKALKFIDISDQKGLKELRGLQRVIDVRDTFLMSVTDVWMFDQQGKLLDPRALEEIERNSLLQGDAIRETLDINLPRPTRMVMAMEVGEKSLLQLLRELKQEGKQGVPRKRLLHYMDNAARGIDYLNTPQHRSIYGDEEGLVSIRHCDIKPDNIMLVGGGAKICDFGLARVADQQEKLRATQSGMAGSAPYMAPECVDPGEPSAQTDQYSLAVTYYELATGELPFSKQDQANVLMILEAHRAGRLDFSLVSEAQQAVLRRATSVKPKSRYRNCVEFVDQLRTCDRPEGIAVPGGDRKAWLVAAVAATIMVIAATGWWYFIKPSGKSITQQIDDEVAEARSASGPEAALDDFRQAVAIYNDVPSDEWDEGARDKERQDLTNQWLEYIVALAPANDQEFSQENALHALRHTQTLLNWQQDDQAAVLRGSLLDRWIDYVAETIVDQTHPVALERARHAISGASDDRTQAPDDIARISGIQPFLSEDDDADQVRQILANMLLMRIEARRSSSREEWEAVHSTAGELVSKAAAQNVQQRGDSQAERWKLAKLHAHATRYVAETRRREIQYEDLARLESALRMLQSSAAMVPAEAEPEHAWRWRQSWEQQQLEEAHRLMSRYVDASPWRVQGSQQLQQLVLAIWPEKGEIDTQTFAGIVAGVDALRRAGEWSSAQARLHQAQDHADDNQAWQEMVEAARLRLLFANDPASHQQELVAELSQDPPQFSTWHAAAQFLREERASQFDSSRSPQAETASNSLVDAIYAESLLLGSESLEPSDIAVQGEWTSLEQSLAQAVATTQDQWFSPYVQYAHALVTNSLGNASSAADNLVELYARQKDADVARGELIMVPYRRLPAASILFAEAEDLGQPHDRRFDPNTVFSVGWDRAFRLLTSGRMLAGSLMTLRQKALWAIAAGRKARETSYNATWEQIASELQGMSTASGTQEGGLDAVSGYIDFLRLESALANGAVPTADSVQRELLESATHALTKLVDLHSDRSEVQEVRHNAFQHVIPPAMEVAQAFEESHADQIPAEMRSTLASIYRTRGMLLRHDEQIARLLREGADQLDPAAEAHQSLRHANELEATVEGLIEEGYALEQIVDPQLERIEELQRLLGEVRQVATTLEANDRISTVEDFTGYVRVIQSRSEPAGGRGPLLDEAIAAFERALSHLEENSPQYGNTLLHLSMAANEKALIVHGEEQVSWLRRASSNAEQAVRILTGSDGDRGYMVWGHALEDLASFGRVDVEANYRAAIAKFSNLVNRRPFAISEVRRARARIARARCQARWLGDCDLGGRSIPMRQEAAQGLREAIATLQNTKGAGSLNNAIREDILHAYFWLGRLNEQEEDLQAALLNYRELAELAKNTPHWPSHQLTYANGLLRGRRPAEAANASQEIVEFFKREQSRDSGFVDARQENIGRVLLFRLKLPDEFRAAPTRSELAWLSESNDEGRRALAAILSERALQRAWSTDFSPQDYQDSLADLSQSGKLIDAVENPNGVQVRRLVAQHRSAEAETEFRRLQNQLLAKEPWKKPSGLVGLDDALSTAAVCDRAIQLWQETLSPSALQLLQSQLGLGEPPQESRCNNPADEVDAMLTASFGPRFVFRQLVEMIILPAANNPQVSEQRSELPEQLTQTEEQLLRAIKPLRRKHLPDDLDATALEDAFRMAIQRIEKKLEQRESEQADEP